MCNEKMEYIIQLLDLTTHKTVIMEVITLIKTYK